MNDNQMAKGRVFRDLHLSDGIFVMPNAWNAGSAAMLEAADFPAIGTTSAGIAYSLGLPDYESALTRESALEETRRMAAAVKVPISADAENGYGHPPDEVAETIRLFGQSGAVGASIEDFATSYGTGKLYELDHAVERIAAAKSAADSLGFPFTITARSECYWVDHPTPFEEAVIRSNAFREAGADCLYVPGIKNAGTIAALVKEVAGPINVVMGLVGDPLTVNQLEDLGVKRLTIGGSLARATFALIRRAAHEIRHDGTFKYSDDQISDAELCRFFSDRIDP